jgi:hypothetical protein
MAHLQDDIELEVLWSWNYRRTHEEPMVFTGALWWTLQLQSGGGGGGVADGTVTRTGRARTATLHSLIMSDFLGHIEFLISPSQDHSGDRALECWTSCVWCMHIVQRAQN